MVEAAILHAAGLRFVAGGRELVSGISLELHAGQVLGILGPNGAGKSTLLRLLAGLSRPAAGRIILDGRDLRAWPLRERARRLGYLPQHFTPHWDHAVSDLLRLGLDRAGQAGPVENAAEEHGVAPLLARHWSSLSGGERGRVLAAMVLAARPAVVLADEATAALDVGQAIALAARLRRAARGGAAVALVAHDINLALRTCDRIAILAEGRLVVVGEPAEVTFSPHLDAAFGVGFTRVQPECGAVCLYPDVTADSGQPS